MGEYVDTNVLAYHLTGDRLFGPLAREFLISVSRGDREACTSVYTYAELFATLRKVGLTPAAIYPLLAKSMTFGLRQLDFTQAIMLQVPSEMGRGLSFGDSIHYLTMKENGMDLIVSEDKDWDRLRDITRVSLSKTTPHE